MATRRIRKKGRKTRRYKKKNGGVNPLNYIYYKLIETTAKREEREAREAREASEKREREASEADVNKIKLHINTVYKNTLNPDNWKELDERSKNAVRASSPLPRSLSSQLKNKTNPNAKRSGHSKR
jgi:hypothetical protein